MKGATAQAVAVPHVARASLATNLFPAAGGALLSVTFLDFSLYPLAWVGFVPVLWALAHAPSPRAALRLGFVAGFFANVPAFHWLVYTMHTFGGFPTPIAAFFYACLSAFSALQFVLLAAGVSAIGFGPLGLAVPVLWVALERLFPNLFPWHLANSQFHLPALLQIGDVTGPYGLSFVMVWFGAGVVLALRRPRQWSALLAAAAAVGAIIAYGLWRMPIVQAEVDAAPPVRVALVQGNIGIREKGNVSLFEINVEKYRDLSRPLQDDVDLLVWPESVAQWWVASDTTQLAPEDNPFPDLRTFLIYGGLAFTPKASRDRRRRADKFNSAFLIAAGGAVLGRYDKQVLLPFGEFLPGASWIPQLAEMSPQTGDFTAGDQMVTLDVPGRLRVAPLVCYEDVPARIAREMTRAGAEALLTIFNDAWFGRSMAPYQHEALALWRAVENRRYFMRVGNAGVTGLIDPFGRISGRLGQFTAEVLQAEIRPLRMQTFYTRYGDVFAWTAVAAAVAWLLFPLLTKEGVRGR